MPSSPWVILPVLYTTVVMISAAFHSLPSKKKHFRDFITEDQYFIYKIQSADFAKIIVFWEVKKTQHT